MNAKKTVKHVIFALVLVAGFFGTSSVAPSIAHADNPNPNAGATTTSSTDTGSGNCNAETQTNNKGEAVNCCGGVQTTIITCTQQGGTSSATNIQKNGVWGLLLIVINILTAGIGVAALGGLAYGAVLYTTAGGSQENIKKARTMLTNVVIGIIAYALMYSLLNFLIPGGLFT